MTLQTKLNINDTIFFLHEKKVIETVIRGIKTETSNIITDIEKDKKAIVTEIVYLCNKEADQRIHIKVEEQYAFKTKAELLKSL